MKPINQQDVLRIFYPIGIVLFIIIGLASAFSNYVYWGNMILSSKISSVASNIFNFVLAWLFYMFWKMQPKEETGLNEEQIDEVIKGAENGK